MSKRTKTVTIANRETGFESAILDVTGWSESSFDRMWDGLVRKIDFAEWVPVYSPARGDDETVAEWLAR